VEMPIISGLNGVRIVPTAGRVKGRRDAGAVGRDSKADLRSGGLDLGRARLRLKGKADAS
jgi:hypothetical protein